MKTRIPAKSQRRFDKHLFEAGQQCPKRLYLDYHEPTEEQESESRRVMSETGKLVLLQPTRTGPNELGSVPVFDAKTWNPIALAGDRLLVRNDREAAAWILPLRAP